MSGPRSGTAAEITHRLVQTFNAIKARPRDGAGHPARGIQRRRAVGTCRLKKSSAAANRATFFLAKTKSPEPRALEGVR